MTHKTCDYFSKCQLAKSACLERTTCLYENMFREEEEVEKMVNDGGYIPMHLAELGVDRFRKKYKGWRGR